MAETPHNIGRSEATSRGQRGFVSLLFTDLCDYTSLAERIDPEDAHALREAFERLAAGIIERHHGLITQVYGDGLLAVFGLPTPDEDHPRHAVEAALALHRGIVDYHWEAFVPRDLFEVHLHSGIHSGLVVAREGDALHGRYDLVGDPVNTAARLCAAAARDEIVVSDVTLSGIEAFFGVETLPPLSLKGKALRLGAHRVVRRTTVSSRFESRMSRGLTQLAGRRSELERLEQETRRLLTGRGGVLAFSGPAGGGKTRLLEEYKKRRAASGVRVYAGYCDRYADVEPLQPFAQILRQLFDVRERSNPESMISVERQLSELELGDPTTRAIILHVLSLQVGSPDSDPAAAKLAIVGALTQVFAVACARAPCVLQLDDWQWADEISHAVLCRLVEQLGERPVLILITLRSEDAQARLPQGVEVVQLPPLNERETHDVAQSLIARSLSPAEITLVHRHSGGNPLFLEELCRALPGELDSLQPGALEQLGVPTTIRGVIHARVAKLPSDQAQVLHVAAVIGNELSRALLEQVSPVANLAHCLAALTRSDLLHPVDARGNWRFKHGITREVVYESIRSAERREIHRSLAERLAAATQTGRIPDQSELLAHHFRGAADYAAAAVYAAQAGDKALASSSLDRAAAQYSAALADYDRAPDSEARRRAWLQISAKWAFVHMYSPDWAQLATLERAARLARELGSAADAARAGYWLGWMYYSLGDQEHAIEQFQSAMPLAEQADDQRLVDQLWLNLGQSHAAACDYERAHGCLERGLRGKQLQPRGRGTPAGYAYALGCRALIAADRGDFAACESDLSAALDAVSGSGHAVEGSLLAQAAMAEIYRGRFPEALAAARAALAVADRVHGSYVRAMAAAFAGYAAFKQTGEPAALRELETAVQQLESCKIGLFLSFCQALLADALQVHGASDEARQCALRALGRAERGDPVGQILSYRVLARAALQLPAAVGAERPAELLARALELAERRDSARERALTRLLLARVSQPTAADALSAALTELERLGLRDPDRAPARA